MLGFFPYFTQVLSFFVGRLNRGGFVFRMPDIQNVLHDILIHPQGLMLQGGAQKPPQLFFILLLQQMPGILLPQGDLLFAQAQNLFGQCVFLRRDLFPGKLQKVFQLVQRNTEQILPKGISS